MTDFAAFIPVVNRQDLLNQVIDSAREIWDYLTIIDNSKSGMETPFDVGVYRTYTPLTFSQSMNVEFELALFNKAKFLLHMHSDAIIPPGAIASLLTAARQVESQGRKWAVLYTLYDVMAIYNPSAYLDLGGYDTNFPDYFSDNDWYHRADLAGYERIDTNISVSHLGSQTINSDPYLRHVTSIKFPLSATLYEKKWGGPPGGEKFSKPYNLDFNGHDPIILTQLT